MVCKVQGLRSVLGFIDQNYCHYCDHHYHYYYHSSHIIATVIPPLLNPSNTHTHPHPVDTSVSDADLVMSIFLNYCDSKANGLGSVQA
jgi:hypothetical protein